MLRNEIQNKTGLTRKAIEYYEEMGLIKPQKFENGYRNYSEKDLAVLTKISLFRKIGMSVTEIKELLSTNSSFLPSILRKKQHQLDLEEKRKTVLELMIKGTNQKLINEKLKVIENEESIYQRLEKAFPGYFGQLLFSAYQPFLNEPIEKSGEEAFSNYIDYLDKLPSFKLTKDEKIYIEKVSSVFDMESLQEVNNTKIKAINNAKEWLNENEDTILQYETFKNSIAYQNSPMKHIQDKLQTFLLANNYYEIAIPLIRKFSKSYDDYYKKLLDANEIYLKHKKTFQ
ncbi:MerR family transcriptional regulator [Streptococcus zalophi]|uniref:MerR family transcriptional regulator n=1 Tax=Streptococcus zalophi TaxID=640031 RepID=A0A934PA81_9STRE|nr:MerR family transcriptional regulator [Streptococcus zalophi]MBJ8349929.1 MerR family transcriptional regulator [Streptococcus zalophi]MCR8966924.1 MerR family transcriptional regulator [Streptococcus zalophi]